MVSNGIFCQASCTLTISYTPPSTIGVCDATASVTAGTSCAVTYTWVPGLYTGANVNGLCAGNYTVYAYDGGGPLCCGSMSGTVTIPSGPTGIGENHDSSDRLFFSDESNLLFIREKTECKVYVLDISGKLISVLTKERDQIKFDLNYLEKGLYILNVVTDNRNRRIKALIK